MLQLEASKAEMAATPVARLAPDDLLRNEPLYELLDLLPRTLEGWRATGDGPPFIRCAGRRVLYRWGDVVEWLRTRRFTSTSEEAA